MVGERFIGKTDYVMDDRNRVAIPSRWRDQFLVPGAMTAGKEPCVVIHTHTSFEEASERVEAIPADTQEGRDERRRFYGYTYPAPKDGQGRVLIDKSLVAYAALKSDVRVVGAGTWFEIWDRATHEAYEATRNGSG